MPGRVMPPLAPVPSPSGAAAGDSTEVTLPRRSLLQGDRVQESVVLTTPFAPGFPFCACRTYDCK